MGDFFKKKKGTTINQEAMQTDEQKQMMGLLSSFASTGKFGDFQAGEDYKGKLGDFDMTELEGIGQNKLKELVSGQMPEMLQLGQNEIKDLLATDKYDPYAKGGVYSGFKKDTMRAADESSDMLKRQMSITGDTFSTANIQEHGKLAERTHDTMNNKLAQLYDTFAQRKLAGAETAARMGGQEEAIKTGRIGMSQSLGSLGRLLKDAEAKSQHQEWVRSRSEWGEVINAAKSVMGTSVPYGVKSMTTPDSPSPFSNLLNAGLQIAGTAVGAYFGSPGAGAAVGKAAGAATSSAFSFAG